MLTAVGGTPGAGDSNDDVINAIIGLTLPNYPIGNPSVWPPEDACVRAYPLIQSPPPRWERGRAGGETDGREGGEEERQMGEREGRRSGVICAGEV